MAKLVYSLATRWIPVHECCEDIWHLAVRERETEGGGGGWGSPETDNGQVLECGDI